MDLDKRARELNMKAAPPPWTASDVVREQLDNDLSRVLTGYSTNTMYVRLKIIGDAPESRELKVQRNVPVYATVLAACADLLEGVWQPKVTGPGYDSVEDGTEPTFEELGLEHNATLTIDCEQDSTPQFILVNIENRESMEGFQRKHNFDTLVHCIMPEGGEDAYGLQYIPHTFVVSGDGKLLMNFDEPTRDYMSVINEASGLPAEKNLSDDEDEDDY